MTTKNVVIKDQHAFMIDVLEKLEIGTTYLKNHKGYVQQRYKQHFAMGEFKHFL